jgi:hypothetical protein
MAYNKRKHLEANIAALRIAFAPSTRLTPQQRDALAAYSGFGALMRLTAGRCGRRPHAMKDRPGTLPAGEGAARTAAPLRRQRTAV